MDSYKSPSPKNAHGGLWEIVILQEVLTVGLQRGKFLVFWMDGGLQEVRPHLEHRGPSVEDIWKGYLFFVKNGI